MVDVAAAMNRVNDAEASAFLEESRRQKGQIYDSGYYNNDIACAVDGYYKYLEKCNAPISVILEQSHATLEIGAHFMRPQDVEVTFKRSGPIMDMQISGEVKNEADLRTFLQRRLSSF